MLVLVLVVTNISDAFNFYREVNPYHISPELAISRDVPATEPENIYPSVLKFHCQFFVLACVHLVCLTQFSHI